MLKKLSVISLVFLFLITVNGADLKTRQPKGFLEGQDTWYGSFYNKNAVHDGKLRTGGWGDEYDTLMRFDLSGLPRTVTQAIMYFYIMPPADGSTTTPINWFRLDSQWQTSTVGWNNQPASTLLGSTVGPGNQAGWFGIDFTSFYNLWRSGNLATLNYGFRMAPLYNNNRFDIFHSSGTSLQGAQPLLYVFYTRQADDNILKMKWPLGGTSCPPVNQSFGVNWSTGKTCAGLIKKHNGVDYQAVAGAPVYAPEDGVVKEVVYDRTGQWAYNIVLEHNHPVSGKYTTVCWHVNPASSVTVAPAGQALTFVPKGMQIATVANLDKDTHFHFGVRIGAYLQNVSGTGGLPQTDCMDPNGVTYPAFPAGFVNPNDTSQVLFH